MNSDTKIGLINLISDPPSWIKGASLGLVANQASIGSGFQHAVDLIDQAFVGQLKTIFGPQHGFFGIKQDNMIESGHDADIKSGRKIYSLYGETRRPEPEMFDGLDVLLIDLVDVGTRVYTFAQTMAFCLEEAAKAGLKVVILDRPNPIGGMMVEGNLLQPDCASFVGLFPIPMRHGLTMGELARLAADEMGLSGIDLEIVQVTGWERDMYFAETGLPWVLPSPNMPWPSTAALYPGQVIWEGTNISEGRGTTLPFHLMGAPFINAGHLVEELGKYALPGVIFRPCSFEPTFNKYEGQLCHGLEIHPTDLTAFKPYQTSLTILELLLKMYPGQVKWKEPPYEYEYDRNPFDLITGDKRIREGLEEGKGAAGILQDLSGNLSEYLNNRVKYLIY